jgi:hypothetical protein
MGKGEAFQPMDGELLLQVVAHGIICSLLPKAAGERSRKEPVIEYPSDQFCGCSGCLVQPVLSSLPVIGPLAAPP